MKRQKKIFGLLLCALMPIVLMPLTLCAQHEITLDGGSGISMMLYRSTVSNKKINLGYAGGISYAYFSPSGTVAFRTGLEITNYNSTMQANNLTDRYYTKDADDEPIDFIYNVNTYDENISALYLQVPLFFQFMNRANERVTKHRFYGNVGFKFGIPVKASLKVNSMNLTSWAYYHNYDNEIFQPAFMGYGTFDLKDLPETKIKLGISITASVEVGMRWHLYHNTLFLYTGLFCDYGLTNLVPASRNSGDGQTHLVNYNPENPTSFTSNSLFYAKEVNALKETVNLVRRVSPLSAGLRIRIGIFMEKPANKIRWARRI